ncbi:MAG: GNAT family N-acetyltransferase [Ferruginibacter sp.]|nr:GNAT family N-acetyltransferase [Ferruginibacter sp.]
MPPILTTPRLYLRQFTLADAPLLLTLNSDPEVLKYLHEPVLKDEAHAIEILNTIIFPQYKNNLGRWAVHLNDSNEFIGWCGLKYRPEIDEIDLGYRFMKKYWGNGYAYESAKHVLDYGFNHLQLKTIVGRTHVENIASLKVLQKIGMQYIKDEMVDNCPVKTFIATN